MDIDDVSQQVRPTLRFQTVCIDCSDANAMADFYGELLGWEITYRDDDFILMRDPGGGAGLSFQARQDYRPPTWPEQRDSQDKMMHLEIRMEDLDAAVAHTLASGGRLAGYQGRDDLRVMLDPAGHPFCLFLE
jgi:catechol 2,3-dioxygenase-like lactoylglutathione lyase family enzyme